jgi:DNA polymerase-3 subunit delta'
MPFDDIRGHSRQVLILQSMLRSGNLPHAFLFTGIEGIGKRTVATGFVKALNCLSLSDDFCGQCLQCRKIDKQIHPDVMIVEPLPEKKSLVIEQIRSLQQEIIFKPLEGKKKAVIIDQAEKMNASVANCLLKTLEEPPEDTVLVLIAHSISDMLPTVLSRCQRLHFSPLSDGDISSLLAAQGMEARQTARLLPLAQGSLQRALMFAGCDFVSRREKIAERLGQGPAAALKLADDLVRDEEVLPMALEFLESWYRDLLVLLEGASDARLYNGDLADGLARAAAGATRATIVEKIKKLRRLQTGAAFNPDMQLGLETVFLH